MAMAAGAPNPHFAEGIRLEHVEKEGAEVEFTASSYGVKSNPRKEYEIVMGKRECDEKDKMNRKGQKVRRTPNAR